METSTESLALPSGREIELAATSQRELVAFLAARGGIQRIQVFDEQDRPHAVELPGSVMRLLLDVLAELAEGNAVRVVPVHAELTTQEAADLLNVSRPHVVKLLEAGQIPFHRTGRHRRVRFADLMAFKAQRERDSHAALERLAQQAQELGLGYE